MTKKTRRILFFVLTILFLIIAPSVWFYSQGYRFDFETKKITQTGAFYFNVFPRNVEIYLTPLDSNFFLGNPKTTKERTDFLFRSILIDNLLPKKYEVEIKKEGFHPWKKTLEIKEKIVTNAKNIVLIPKNPEPLLLSEGVQNFFVSPDSRKIILKEFETVEKKDWSLKLLELERNLKIHLFNREDISNTKISIIDLNFSSDSRKILLKTNLKKELKFFLIDLEKTPPRLISLDFLGKEINNIFFHPINNQKLFILKNGSIFEADFIQEKISSIILENVIFFQIINRDIYYSLDSQALAKREEENSFSATSKNKTGFLFKTDSSFSQKEKINKAPFPFEKNKNYKLYLFLDRIFLQENNQKLYLFDSDSKNFIHFAEANKKPKISPDLKKLSYFSNHEIEILFLKEEIDQPQKKAGEKQLIARFSEKIGNVFWLTAHYLIFNVEDKIKIAEIDDRDKINIINFLEFREPKIFWNNYLKRLYILSNENFYSLELSLP